MLHALARFAVRTRSPRGARFAPLTALCLSLTLGAGAAFGQDRQIVTDPELNATLLAFEAQFPQYVATHPALTSGSSGPITLQGTKGKISFTFLMEGQYTIDYGTLVFSPTNPLSTNRFVTTLGVDSVTHTGAAAMMITRKGRTYNLECPDNSFTARSVVFTCEVEVRADGGVTITNPDVSLDPKSIALSVPCLSRPSSKAADGDEESLDGAEIEIPEDALREELAKAVVRMLAAPPPGNTPNANTLNKTNQALTSAAQSSSSSIFQSTTEAVTTAGTAAASGGTLPCGGTLQADVAAIMLDLEAISAQANEQGFQQAMETLAADLEAILPTLSAPSQELVQELVDDLSAAVSEDSPGGTEITRAEEAILELDLYNVILSTGITSEQTATIVNDILGVVSTLEGISTAQLQADVEKFFADAQACGGQ